MPRQRSYPCVLPREDCSSDSDSTPELIVVRRSARSRHLRKSSSSSSLVDMHTRSKGAASIEDTSIKAISRGRPTKAVKAQITYGTKPTKRSRSDQFTRRVASTNVITPTKIQVPTLHSPPPTGRSRFVKSKEVALSKPSHLITPITTPTKRARSIGALLAESSSEDEGDDEVAEDLLSRSKSSVKHPPTPRMTPTKNARPLASTSSSVQSTPSKRKRARIQEEPEVAEEAMEVDATLTFENAGDAEEEQADSDDELLLKETFPPKTPSPQKKKKADVTPRRSSTRAERLPIAQADIEAMPRALRSRLVGWHMDDDEQGSPRPTSSPTRRASSRSESVTVEDYSAAEPDVASSDIIPTQRRPTSSARLYSRQSLAFLFRRITRTLNGWSLPKPQRPNEPFDARDAMAHPYLADGFDQWEKPLRYAMNGVVDQNVGNCLIMLGPRGVGKTMLFERTVRVLEKAHGKDKFIIVRLNGLVHTTDRHALRSIAYQLKIQGFSDEDGDFGSNAATMSTLLRMLEPANDPRSVAEKPIVILVDEFDLFAQHPRQSFLYSLLDIVQGNRRKAGMGVIGLSSRSDCLSILEKRVRSRCQSQVHQIILPNDFENYLEMAKRLLSVDHGLFSEMGSGQMAELAMDWNHEVEAFIDAPSSQEYLERVWSIHGNNPARLLQALSPLATRCESLVAQVGESDESMLPELSMAMLQNGIASAQRNDLLLDQLTILDLTVCISAKHMRAHYDNVVNVEQLYRCYLEHVQRGKMTVATKPYTRLAFCMAFDRLRALEIFLPWSGKPSHYVAPSQGDGYKSFKFVPWDVSLDESILARHKKAKDVPEPLRKWLKSQDA